MRNIAFFLYNMKNIKKGLRIALLTAIYWKGYIGSLKLWPPVAQGYYLNSHTRLL